MLIQLDKVGADTHIKNIVIEKDGVPNGAIVEVGEYGDYDNYNSKEVANVDNELVMLVAPFLDETGMVDEIDFKFKKGKVVRGYCFRKNDVITVTIDGITDATNVKANMVGKFVVPEIGSYFGKIDSAKSGSLAFKVIDVDTLNGKDALVLEAQ